MLSRHYFFQILVIFVTVLSGSLLSVIKDFLENPASLARLLGQSIPGIGAYFLQLLVTKALVSNFVEASRPWPLIQSYLAAVFGDSPPWAASSSAPGAARPRGPGRAAAADPDAAPQIDDAPEFKYGHVVPQILMVVLVASLYAAIAPLMLVPAALYFLGAEVVYARNFMLVYVRRYESGGENLMGNLAFYVALSLIIAQVTIFSYISLGSVQGSDATTKSEAMAYRQALLLLPLPVATYVHYRRLMHHYVVPATFLHREAAAHLDLFADLSEHLDPHYYKQPALVSDPAGGGADDRDPENPLCVERASLNIDTPPPSAHSAEPL